MSSDVPDDKTPSKPKKDTSVKAKPKKRKSQPTVTVTTAQIHAPPEDDILLSDNDIVTAEDPVVAPVIPTAPVIPDPVPVKKQRLNLQPTTTVPGGSTLV